MQVRLAELYQICSESGAASVQQLGFDQFAELLVLCACEPEDVASMCPALVLTHVSQMINSMMQDDAAMTQLEGWRSCSRPAAKNVKVSSPLKSPTKSPRGLTQGCLSASLTASLATSLPHPLPHCPTHYLTHCLSALVVVNALC